MVKLIKLFLRPNTIANRTDRELAFVFIFTHLFGPLLVQPMWAYLWYITTDEKQHLILLMGMTLSFAALPFFLHWTGRIRLLSMISFQMLAGTSLFASFHYGGFNSPFLPWFIVSLLLGLFYQSRNYQIVLGLFTIDVVIFAVLVMNNEYRQSISISQMDILGWLSIGSATIYVTWMALYYSRIVGLKAELEGEVERGRLASEKLESARATAEELGRQRSKFFSKMGHELRTPLNAIIGYSEILIEDLEDEGQKEDPHHADLVRIRAAGKHLMSLVSRVLDNDTIIQGDDHIEVSSVQLCDICESVSATAMPSVKKAGNQFIVNCHDPDAILVTDATKLRQVIINLLSNAAKFTNDGVVMLDLVVVERADRKILKVAVSDTGIGIPADKLKSIFRNYEQADVETVAKYGGTGIGLALSKNLTHLMGGEISVKSTPGRGSCFTAWIPASFDQLNLPHLAPKKVLLEKTLSDFENSNAFHKEEPIL